MANTEAQKRAMRRWSGEGLTDVDGADAKPKVESVHVRIPKGWRDKIQEYVKESNKYASVNDMICQLIRNEIPGIDDE